MLHFRRAPPAGAGAAAGDDASLSAGRHHEGKRQPSLSSALGGTRSLALLAVGALLGGGGTYAALGCRAAPRPTWLHRLDTFTHALRGRTFADIARGDKWNNPAAPPEERATVAGPGSTVAYTEAVREWLGRVLVEQRVRTMADLSCSELLWQPLIPGWTGLESFAGYDIVPDVVERARTRAEAARGAASTPALHFAVADLVASSPHDDPLPAVDLVLLRDTLMHVPPTDALHALERIDASGSSWLATTTFDTGDHASNVFILPGSWYAINLRQAPFLLGPPVASVLEGKPGVDRYGQKRLALWRLPVLGRSPGEVHEAALAAAAAAVAGASNGTVT